MDIYREEILDHFKNPRNFGLVPRGGRGKKWCWVEERNASCGDVVEMGIEVKEGRIREIRFKGEGCAVSMAATSMLTEMVKGKKINEVKRIGEKEMVKKLGIKISGGRKKCATLGLVSLKKALKEYEEKK